MKKILSLILSIVMLLSITAGIDMSAYASVYSNDGKFEYTLNRNDQATILYYAGASSNVTVPSKIDGYKVIAIGDYAFSPEYNRGYRGFTLNSITFPNTLERIGRSAFEGCDGLTKLKIPDSVTHIGIDAFAYCSNISNFVMGKGVIDVGSRAFLYCSKIKAVTFGNRIDSIGRAAFSGCVSITNVTIPYFPNISSYAFSECTNLKNLKIGRNLSEAELRIAVRNIGVRVIDDYAFYNCKSLKSVRILSADFYTNIGYDAFGYYKDKAHSEPTIVKGFTIIADGDSAVWSYAKKNRISFVNTYSLKLSKSSYSYDGKIKKPSVTVKNANNVTLKKNKDYKISYSKGRKNVGTYTVTITLKGNYSGTVKKSFTIRPKATSISKLNAGKKKFTVKWKKITTQTTGYQIQYSTSSKFKSAKTVTVSKNKTTSKTISKLKAKKKYYVRIRTYKTVNGKKIYSSWSKAKTVATKR